MIVAGMGDALRDDVHAVAAGSVPKPFLARMTWG